MSRSLEEEVQRHRLAGRLSRAVAGLSSAPSGRLPHPWAPPGPELDVVPTYRGTGHA